MQQQNSGIGVGSGPITNTLTTSGQNQQYAYSIPSDANNAHGLYPSKMN